MSNSIKFRCSDDSEFRQQRLDRLVGYLIACFRLLELNTLNKIFLLEDHKGQLEVYWRDCQSELERQILAHAWYHVGGEPSEFVTHHNEE